MVPISLRPNGRESRPSKKPSLVLFPSSELVFGSFTLTLPASDIWPGGLAPTLALPGLFCGYRLPVMVGTTTTRIHPLCPTQSHTHSFSYTHASTCACMLARMRTPTLSHTLIHSLMQSCTQLLSYIDTLARTHTYTHTHTDKTYARTHSFC